MIIYNQMWRKRQKHEAHLITNPILVNSNKLANITPITKTVSILSWQEDFLV